MNHDPKPCGDCARFLSAARKKGEQGPGHCEGFDRPAYSTDQPCVLFNERGAWKTRQGEMPSKAGEKQRRGTTA